MKSITKFVLMESEGQIADSKEEEGSSKEVLKDLLKKNWTRTAKEKKVKEDLSREKLQQMMVIIPEQGIHVEALQTNYLIINWEIYTEGTRQYWKIIRIGNITEVHQFFVDMIKAFDREDLVKLWSLIKERFNSSNATKDKEIALWFKLKRLFEPDEDDELWKFESFKLIWRLYDWCRVHHISTRYEQDIFMLVEKEYPLLREALLMMLVQKLQVDEHNKIAEELLRKIFMQAERPIK
nr:hypothetical protein [Tanacetum cinerariifolium]